MRFRCVRTQLVADSLILKVNILRSDELNQIRQVINFQSSMNRALEQSCSTGRFTFDAQSRGEFRKVR